MRTFRWNAPIIMGAGALVVSVLAPASHPPKAEESGAQVAVGGATTRNPRLKELRARLDQSDRQAAVQALQLALDRGWGRGDAGVATPGARAHRQDQACVGIPRRQGPGLPACRLFHLAWRLREGDRGQRLPREGWFLVARGLNGDRDGLALLRRSQRHSPLGPKRTPPSNFRTSGSRRCARARRSSCSQDGQLADGSPFRPSSCRAGLRAKTRDASRRLASSSARH